ncbi:hypothetical protein Tco_0608073 [Tanacetum coccineum]
MPSATNSAFHSLPGFTPDKPDTDVNELLHRWIHFQPDVKSLGKAAHITVESVQTMRQRAEKVLDIENKSHCPGKELEVPISRDEIRRAVWDCGENKSPGPDGFTFEFFRKFWNIVGPDLCLAVEWFFHHASFPVGCNSFVLIALIPEQH